MTTIIAVNQTVGALALNQIPVPDNEIPAGVGATVTLTDYATVSEIQDDVDLIAHITAGDCILNDGASDLTQAQSLAVTSTVTATLEGTAVMESLVDAKGDLIAGTADDEVERLPVGSNNDVLTADSSEATGVKWVAPAPSAYSDYYESGSTAIATSATTLGLDTSRQSNALFVLATDQVTVQTGGAGDYLVRYECSTNESSTGAIGVAAWLEVNAVEVVASRSYTEHYTSGTDNTCGSTQILTLADGDVLRLRGQMITGAGTIDTLAGGVSLTILAPGATGPTGATGAGSSVIVQDSGGTVSGGPHSTLNFTGAATAVDAGAGVATINLTDAKFANYYNSAQYTGITTTVSTLPFPTTRIGNAAFTMDGSGEELTINTAGSYRIDYGCSTAEASSSDITADMWVEVDSGGGFSEPGGTRSRFFHDSNGEEGGNAGFAILELDAADVIRIRAEVVTGSDQLNTLENGLRLSIQTVGANGSDGATGPTGPQGPAGAGSSVIVEDEGSVVAGGPHTNLDFVGDAVTVTNAGGGVANIAIDGFTPNISQYRATANLSIATSPTTVVLNATDFEDSNYTRSGENITINTAGVYRISYNVFFTTTGNFRRTIAAWVENNTSVITPSYSADYARNNVDNEGSAGATFMVQLAGSDVVRLRCESVGTSGTCQGEGNRMWICLEFVRT